MVAEECRPQPGRSVLDQLPSPLRLATVKARVLIRCIQTEKLPILVLECEKATAVLTLEAAIGKSGREVSVPARIHVMVSRHRKRQHVATLIDGPPSQEPAFDLAFGAGVVDVAEVDD